MLVNVKDKVFEAHVVNTVGYGDAQAVLAALNIPFMVDKNGKLLIGLRGLATAARLPLHYDQNTNTLYLASEPLPDLPVEPVGRDRKPWHSVQAPIFSGPGDRRPGLLALVINQFQVASNPRYQANQQGANETYCNIFVWDVTRALGCEVPHWIVGDGHPSEPGYGRELDANGVIMWLRSHGRNHGWRSVSAEDALTAANQGRPAIAAWYNPGGIGHVAVVRPGQYDRVRKLPIAQAGALNFDDKYLVDGFGKARGIEFFNHD